MTRRGGACARTSSRGWCTSGWAPIRWGTSRGRARTAARDRRHHPAPQRARARALGGGVVALLRQRRPVEQQQVDGRAANLGGQRVRRTRDDRLAAAAVGPALAAARARHRWVDFRREEERGARALAQQARQLAAAAVHLGRVEVAEPRGERSINARVEALAVAVAVGYHGQQHAVGQLDVRRAAA